MKVVVAIDSFKGSISSLQAGEAAKRGILAAKPDAEVLVRPLADGGEGTTEALILGLGGEQITLQVAGPDGKEVACSYGIVKGADARSPIAVMEMAAAAGITLVHEKDPLHATTRGVGEMIADAVRRGIRDFIIGIGGSATNDGGIGMLKALGYEFLDAEGSDVGEGAEALEKIASVHSNRRIPDLQRCRFRVACDVKNPLCGSDGATYTFGPQKGLTSDLLEAIDQGMDHYARMTAHFLQEKASARVKISVDAEHSAHPEDCDTDRCFSKLHEIPGAGAAGGIGYAFLAYLNAELVPGARLILDAVGLEKDICEADVVVTGEGCLDSQTSMGKAPIAVAKLAKKHGAKILAFAGSIAPDAKALKDGNFDACFPILREISTLEEAMKPENASANLTATAEQVFRLF